ncbi:hypothetical protein SELMODRAFT_416695 [Selaginella moellendorffii]|uniref:Uncharacterized protein n=1 Tax=Selaginella moellendorffii TaxID=88036 RepID=D8S044_SELML|nr:uncharacterized protein LOC9649333 [Selaginella moellendorffii]EFJ22265.1 hypothetical protein SELMODRAFT_416695 [Selaginella moellendorffii]|eukprot:XP_002976596.1 uncharacterized protein LOC9649333 [Selaginella moellendorffii]
MEQGLLSPNGEYDLADIYKGWNLGRHWIMWRQFLMNLVCHGFTAYGFYMATIHWPAQLSPQLAPVGYFPAMLLSVSMLVRFGRKKALTYGFLVGGISGVLSAMITNQWVVLLPVVILFCGLCTPAAILSPEAWNDGRSLVIFMVVLIMRQMANLACIVAAIVAPPVGWQVQAVALVGSTAAIVYAMLFHFYMLQSPLEILGGCEGLRGMDIDQRLAVRQEMAIEALRGFAEAAGKTLPENLKSLRKTECCPLL